MSFLAPQSDMATTATLQPGAYGLEQHDGLDPFLGSQDAQRHRYSAFDNSQFSLYVNGSPEQAKRALQAHLSETARRLQETSVLGNSLVQQKKELEERLREVESQQANNDIGPELRQRLAELEKEFNEVGRETARAFLPRSRVPSGETDAMAGASVYSSEAIHSPTKVSVPSRKQRNQQPSRINDIALATEISTSLLNQLKELQAVLLEKDEALKAANLDRSQLEIEVEGLSQRLRTLDESENRLKDVNWNLETQVRELDAAVKAAADREHRINHNLSLAQTEKATLERDLEELKQMHAKLNDDHVAKTKHHETELSNLRRNVSTGETERNALQRKVDELAAQNQELAKHVAYRMREAERAASDENSPDDVVEEGDTITPEGSPPPSPAKPTPRHGQLESETLKHSLNHAHRMIQQLKNNIHREKTEKLELKRMLQDARDELETNRNSVHGLSSASKRRRAEKDVFKKPPRPDRLGAFRIASEVVVDDDEWEEHEPQQSPSKRSRESIPGAFPGGFSSAADTATETSDAFETANERDDNATETDAFQTGAETLDGDSSDDLTETEGGPSMGTIRARPSPLAIAGNRDSYQSTASTSGDEGNDTDAKTPVKSEHPRYKLKMRQAGYRRSTARSIQDVFSSPAAQDSPGSLVNNSNSSTPAQGQSLFAELGAFSGEESDDGSGAEGTPSRSSMLSPESSPEGRRKSALGRSPLQSVSAPKPVMVDSEMMTEPWVPEGYSDLGLSSISSSGTEPNAPRRPSLRVSSLSTQDTHPRTLPPPSMHLLPSAIQHTEPRLPEQSPLSMSTFSAQDTVPRALPPPSMHLLPAAIQHTEPKLPEKSPLDMSAFSAQDTVPSAPLPPSLHMSAVSSRDTEPLSPVVEKIVRPSLNVSSISQEGTEPVFPVVEKMVPPSLDVSSISQQGTEPSEFERPNMVLPTPVLMSVVSAQATEPVAPSHETVYAVSQSRGANVEELQERAPLQISSVHSQTTSPVEVATIKPTLSQFSSQATEPLEPRRPVFSQYSMLSSQATQPLEPRRPAPPQFSALAAQTTEPREAIRPPYQLSQLSSQVISPVEPPRPSPLQVAVPSSQATEPLEPVRPPPNRLSPFAVQQTVPVAPSPPSHPENRFSAVTVLQDTQPESPTLPHFLPNPSRPSTANRVPQLILSLSTIFSQDTAPQAPSRPATAHRTLPVTASTSAHVASAADESTAQEGSKLGFFNAVLPWSTTGGEKSIRKESLNDMARGGRAPLAPIAPNVAHANQSTLPPKAARPVTVDEGTQTMVSADQIDKLLAVRSAQRHSNTLAAAGIERQMSPPSSPRKGTLDPNRTPRRPGSSSSIRSRAPSPPPLPADHKEVIAAALKTPSIISGPPSEMGPPVMPASAYKKRPQTPTIRPATTAVNSPPKTDGTTPRAHHDTSQSEADRSGAISSMTHRSSITSFASELDRSFDVANPFQLQTGLDPNKTDPRMIQAITQTMIGEFLWKYTRKVGGREGMSKDRHRRFFWVHPYTRTLYWSEQDPATAGRNQLKAKSVAIEAVQVVTDDNPFPPGLHRKSLVIITPGRTIKFTASTGQRHDTWFNALSYLLQRTGDENGVITEEQRDEISEFNPAARSLSRQTMRSRASSYLSHRTSSPFSHHSSPQHPKVPTLRHPASPSKRAMSTEPPQESGRLSSLSGMFRPSSALRNSFSTRRSRTAAQESDAYVPADNDSNYDLTQELATKHVQNAEQFAGHVEFGMENVRACCDGKHDVGHLHTHSHRHRHSKNPRSSVAGSVSSRSQSRNEPRNESRNSARTPSRTEARTPSRNRHRHPTEEVQTPNSSTGY